MCGESLPPPPQDNLRWAGALLAALLMATAAAGAAYAAGAFSAQSSPDGAVRQFFDAIQRQDRALLAQTVAPAERDSVLSGFQFQAQERLRIRGLQLTDGAAQGNRVAVSVVLSFDVLDQTGSVVRSRDGVSLPSPIVLEQVGTLWYVIGGTSVATGSSPPPSPGASPQPSATPGSPAPSPSPSPS